MRFGLGADGLKEGLCHLLGEQPVAVLGEGGRMEDRLVHGQADKPAQQQVVGKLLTEAALGGNGVEDLQQLGAQQVLGGDRGPAAGGIERIQGGADLRKGGIDQRSDGAQGMIIGHHIL